MASLTRNPGRGGGAGEVYGLPSYLRQTTHHCIILLTKLLPCTIQYLALICVRVSFTPLWKTFSCALLTINTARWCCLLRNIGCLVAYCKSTLSNLHPHLQIPLWSKNSLNCLFHSLKRVSWVSKVCACPIHSLSASSISSGSKIIDRLIPVDLALFLSNLKSLALV